MHGGSDGSKCSIEQTRSNLASVAELSYSLQARQIVMLRRVPNATHFGVLHGEHAAKAAAELTRFVWTAETIHLSILGATPALFNALLPDAEGTPGLLSYAVLYAIWVAVLCLISGLVLELQIGPMLLSLQSRVALWKFAQIFMVAFVFAAFALANQAAGGKGGAGGGLFPTSPIVAGGFAGSGAGSETASTSTSKTGSKAWRRI